MSFGVKIGLRETGCKRWFVGGWGRAYDLSSNPRHFELTLRNFSTIAMLAFKTNIWLFVENFRIGMCKNWFMNFV
jgi:hypothetical protein